MNIREILVTQKEREVPIVYEGFSIEKTLDTMLKFRHSRLVYVVNDNDEPLIPRDWHEYLVDYALRW